MQIASGSITIPGFGPINAPNGVPTGGLSTLEIIMKNGLVLILVIAVILALFFLIAGGIRWTASGGDKTALETARKQIIFSIVGLIVCFISFFIMAIMGNIFNVTLFR